MGAEPLKRHLSFLLFSEILYSHHRLNKRGVRWGVETEPGREKFPVNNKADAANILKVSEPGILTPSGVES